MFVKHFSRGLILFAMLFTLSLAANAGPVAGYPSYLVRAGEPLSVGITAYYSPSNHEGLLLSCSDAVAMAWAFDGGGYGDFEFYLNGAFTYTPYNPDWCGTDWVWYAVTDGNGNFSDEAYVTFNVYAEPVALNQSYTVNTPTFSVGAPGVLAGSVGISPYVAGYTQPAHGTLAGNADGSFNYLPAIGFVGTDSFTYTMSDGYSNAVPATVTLNVLAFPRAAEQSYDVIGGRSISVTTPGLLANSIGTPSHNPLTVSGNTAPSHGALAVFPDGNFVYQPFPGFTGTDSFTYTLTDGSATSAPATVTLAVYATPVAANQDYTACAGSTLSVPGPGLLTNAVCANPRIVGNTQPMNGTLQVNADGSFTYTPAAGFVGPDSFTYTLTDGYATTAPASVTITVFAVPVARNDVYSAVAGQTLTVDDYHTPKIVFAADTYMDAFNDLYVPLDLTLLAQHGTNGSSIAYPMPPSPWTADDVVTQYNQYDMHSILAWNVTLDAGALQMANSLGITVWYFNNPSTCYWDADWLTWQGLPCGVLDNDSTADCLLLSANLLKTTSNGSLTLNAIGSFSYTPNAGFLGTDSFTYTASDAYATSAPATVTINVVAQTTPIANPDSYTTPQGQTLTIFGPRATGPVQNFTGHLQFDFFTPNLSDVVELESWLNTGEFACTPRGFNTNNIITLADVQQAQSAGQTLVAWQVNIDPEAQRYADANGIPIITATSLSELFDALDQMVNNPPPFGVLANDIDADGNPPLTATLVATTTHGKLSFSADGSFTYTPTAGFAGTDSFTYTATNGYTTSAPATVTISVVATPVANNDHYTMDDGQTLTVNAPGLLANDTVAGGGTLTVSVIDMPEFGQATVNADGSFSYTPNAGTSGYDSFSYYAVNGIARSAPAVVYIHVYPLPVAKNDTYNVAIGQMLQVGAPGVLANDTNSSGGVLSTLINLAPTYGQLTLNADGSFSYLPNAGFIGTDSFTYTATDGMGYSTPATVTLFVYTVPVAMFDAYSTLQGQKLIVSAANGVLANDTNADGTPLGAVLVTAPAHGQLTLNADGSFSYSPSAGYSGPDSFTYRATDEYTGSLPASVFITVFSIPVAMNDAYWAITGQELDVSAVNGVLANDANADANPCSASLVTAPAHGQLTLYADGSFSYLPNNGYTGTDTFSYTATDGHATSAPAAVTLTITAIPVANADAYTAVQGKTLILAASGVLANDTTADGGTLHAVPATPPAHGQLTLNANGSFSYTPTAGFWGTDSFTYTATEGIAISAPATVTLTVASLPLAAASAYTTIQGTMLAVTAPGVLANATNADGHALTALLVCSPSHGQVTLHADGSFLYAPHDGFYGADSFSYAATDGQAVSAPALVNITVISVPVANADAYAMNQDQVLGVNQAAGVLANDTNADGNALSALLATGPSHGQLTLNPDGSFSYTPTAGFWGTDSFTYTAMNGMVASAPATVTLTIHSLPVANDDAYQTFSGQALTVSSPGVMTNDANADGNALTAHLATGPENGQLTFNADGSFRYTPSAGFNGPDSFTYTVADAYAASAPATVTITVSSVPVANDESYLAVPGQMLTVPAVGTAPLVIDAFAPSTQAQWALVLPFMTFHYTVEHDTYPFYWAPNGTYISTVSYNSTAFHNVTLADVQAAQQDGHTIVAWQEPVDADAQAYADANGVQLITAAQLSDLWSAISQAAEQTRGGILVNDLDADGKTLQRDAGDPAGTWPIDAQRRWLLQLPAR